jgi:hypothetical protein
MNETNETDSASGEEKSKTDPLTADLQYFKTDNPNKRYGNDNPPIHSLASLINEEVKKSPEYQDLLETKGKKCGDKYGHSIHVKQATAFITIVKTLQKRDINYIGGGNAMHTDIWLSDAILYMSRGDTFKSMFYSGKRGDTTISFSPKPKKTCSVFVPQLLALASVQEDLSSSQFYKHFEQYPNKDSLMLVTNFCGDGIIDFLKLYAEQNKKTGIALIITNQSIPVGFRTYAANCGKSKISIAIRDTSPPIRPDYDSDDESKAGSNTGFTLLHDDDGSLDSNYIPDLRNGMEDLTDLPFGDIFDSGKQDQYDSDTAGSAGSDTVIIDDDDGSNYIPDIDLPFRDIFSNISSSSSPASPSSLSMSIAHSPHSPHSPHKKRKTSVWDKDYQPGEPISSADSGSDTDKMVSRKQIILPVNETQAFIKKCTPFLNSLSTTEDSSLEAVEDEKAKDIIRSLLISSLLISNIPESFKITILLSFMENVSNRIDGTNTNDGKAALTESLSYLLSLCHYINEESHFELLNDIVNNMISNAKINNSIVSTFVEYLAQIVAENRQNIEKSNALLYMIKSIASIDSIQTFAHSTKILGNLVNIYAKRAPSPSGVERFFEN